MVVFLLLLVILGVRYGASPVASIPSATVLTFNVRGPLSESRSSTNLSTFLSRTSFSLRDLIKALDQASRDPRVKGVLFRVDHAHLGIAQIQEIHGALRRLRAQGKFTLVHADTFGEMAPGTLPYYLASGFDEVALQPFGSFNFVGLGTDLPFVRGFLDEVRIVPRFDRRAEYKSLLETYTEEEISEANREATQGLLDALMTQIRHDIARERDLKNSEIDQILEEAPLYDAQQAKTLGFVDQVAYLDEFEAYALEKAGQGATFLRLAKYKAAMARAQDREASTKTEPPSKVGVIYGVGNISRTHTKQESPLMGGRLFGTEEMTEAFRQVLRDESVKALVVRVNTPGGSPTGSETIWRLIRQVRDRGIPVVVSMSDMAASGGYWLATAANKIVAHPGTITGSIGVTGGKMVLAGFWERLGIGWTALQSGTNAQAMSPHHDFTEAQWRQIQHWLDFTYETFMRKVVEGRGLPPEHVAEIAKGRVWSGAEAFQFGLVDALGGMEEAVALAKELAHIKPDARVELAEFPRSKSMAERLLSLFEIDSAFEDFSVAAPGGTLGMFLQDVKALLEEFSREPLSIQHPYKNFLRG